VEDQEIGHVYGAWLIRSKSKKGYKCLCLGCKKSTRVIRLSSLRAGSTLMCRACSRKGSKTNKPPEYKTWTGMIQRCHNSANKDYPNYGGRGITVCDLWRNSFEAFFMHVGSKPDPKYTIDRIDTNGHYEPGNVRWLSRTEQNRNQRSNINLTIDGTTKTISEWSYHPDCKVTRRALYKRIHNGWPPREAVFGDKLPVGGRRNSGGAKTK
jgi:hypothetical protein